MLFRLTTSNIELERASDEIRTAYSRAGAVQDPVSLSSLIIVTWNDLRSASDQNSVSETTLTIKYYK